MISVTLQLKFLISEIYFLLNSEDASCHVFIYNKINLTDKYHLKALIHIKD